MLFADAPLIQTPRLKLRTWRDDDLAPFAALNADAEVVRYLLRPLSREASDALVAVRTATFSTTGIGWWAVEAPGVAEFIGALGLSAPSYEAPFTPCIEIAWRFARAHWGHGFATEAARAVIDHGFTQAGLQEIVALTVPANTRSRAVMERLGMTRSAHDDFDHPMVPAGHPLVRHVLYRRRRAAGGAGAGTAK